MENVLMNGILAMPLGWKLWIFWMMIINTASVAFLKEVPARICLALWIANGITMPLMAESLGYVRLLGLSHVIWWTPLAIYLFRKRKDFDRTTWFGRWAIAVLLTNSVSLIIDYVDVIRYIAGDRG